MALSYMLLLFLLMLHTHVYVCMNYWLNNLSSWTLDQVFYLLIDC
jgi:hypothetical protein